MVRLRGATAFDYSVCALHRHDVAYAAGCLDQINRSHDPVVREALWRSAVFHYAKCFVHSDRRPRLDVRRTLPGDVQGQEIHRFFVKLASKQAAYEASPHWRCVPGAALNGPSDPTKVKRIVAFMVVAETLDQTNFSNLSTLVAETRRFLDAEMKRIAQVLAQELEGTPYAVLASMPKVTYASPTGDGAARRQGKGDLSHE